MANPNIISVTTLTGNTTYLAPNNTSAAVLLSNAAASNTLYKVCMIQATNVSASTANTTVSINNAAAGAGTAYRIAYQISVPANSSLIVIDKSTAFYLPENTSIVVTSGTGSAIEYVCAYDSIS